MPYFDCVVNGQQMKAHIEPGLKTSTMSKVRNVKYIDYLTFKLISIISKEKLALL